MPNDKRCPNCGTHMAETEPVQGQPFPHEFCPKCLGDWFAYVAYGNRRFFGPHTESDPFPPPIPPPFPPPIGSSSSSSS